MNLLSRLSTARPGIKLALGGVAALVLLVAMFDWNWFRPALERYLSRTSQRSVRIVDLHIGLNATLQPVVRLRGVHVQNAPWADARPFAVAGEARFTFSWVSLFQRVRVVTQLVLIDADIHLARQADGLRNWRLTRPDDRGPARMLVLSLEPLRSSLRLVHQGVGLTLQTTSSPLPQPEGALTQRVSFSGTYREAHFAGEALAGPVLSLQRTGEFFALRGQAKSGETVLTLDGRVADLIKLGGLDAQLRLSGPSLGQLKPFFPHQPWPASPPYRAEARVTKQGNTISAKALLARLGRSDLAGELGYDKKDDRASVQATLHSDKLDLAELMRLAPPPAKPAAGEARAHRLLPQSALPLAPLQQIDVTLAWKVDTLQAPALPALSGLQMRATLGPEQLQISLQDSQLAGGRLKGQFDLAHRTPTPNVRLALQAQGVRLEKLVDAPSPIEGPLSGQLQLSGHGDSVAAWLGSASGQLSLALQGGSLSPRLDAKLGLNAGKLLRSFLAGDRQVPIRCGSVVIDFKGGTGTTRELVLDTAHTRIEGQGSVHLRDETWVLLLTPQAHQSSLLTLNSSVRAEGSFRDASYKLVERVPTGKQAAPGCD